MSSNVKDFSVSQGETFHPTIRWAGVALTTVPVAAISQSAPVVVTAWAHAVPPGWPVALASVGGMSQINARRYPPQGDDWHAATVIDVDRVSLNDMNSADFGAYASGGFLVYATPMALDGVTVHMAIYSSPDRSGTPLATLTSGAGITVDARARTIIPELQTAGLAWDIGYYELDATDSAGVVTRILTGTITLTD
jgi:hypothetical protein